MSDLSPETSKLLELARGASTLDGARRAQIKAGLVAKIAAGGAVGGAAAQLSWGKLGWLSSSLIKGFSALLVLSAVGAGVYLGVRTSAERSVATTGVAQAGPSDPQRGNSEPAKTGSATDANAAPFGATSPETSSARAPSTASEANAKSLASASASAGAGAGASASASASASRVAAAADTTRSVPADDAKRPSAPSNADTLAEETKLLRDADQALRAGDAQRALSLLQEDGARFPHGALEPERAQELMLARCKLGQVEMKTAQNYLASHANSAFAARLQDACGVPAAR
jgi:hypothetical protein